MRALESAPFDEVKTRVQGNPDVSDDSVRKLVSQVNTSLIGLGAKLQFSTGAGFVHRKTLPE